MKMTTLKESGKLTKMPKNKIIFRKGESGHEMYIILSGAVNIYANEHNKEAPPLATLKSGDFFGEMALLEDYPRSTTAIVEEESLFLVIDKPKFKEAIQTDPGFAIKIMQSLSNRLRRQTKRYAELEQDLCNKDPEVEEIVETSSSEPVSFEPDLPENPPNFSMTISEKPELIFSEEFLQENFFPENHMLYKVPEPDTYKDYIAEKQKECPVCGTKFNAFLVRYSKLNLTRIEEDFRMVYKDFDPIWYALWSCPNCHYTNFHEEFPKKLRKYHQDAFWEKSKKLKEVFQDIPHEERTIDDVINYYYQALQALLLKKESSKELGKIWLRLSWLYKDLGDWNMYEKSYLQAFAYYFDYYYTIGTTSTKEDQQLSYILGQFFIKFNNEQYARKHFLKAIVKKDGDQKINDLAYDKIQDIKKSQKEKGS